MSDLPDALDSLVARLTAAVPSVESAFPFFTLEDRDAGYVIDVEDIPDDVTRAFDVRIANLPADADSPGWPLCRWRFEVDVRIRYPLAPRHQWDRVMIADAPVVANALIHSGIEPAWHASIVSVEPPVPQPISDIVAGDGRPVARLAVYRFAVLVDEHVGDGP